MSLSDARFVIKSYFVRLNVKCCMECFASLVAQRVPMDYIRPN